MEHDDNSNRIDDGQLSSSTEIFEGDDNAREPNPPVDVVSGAASMKNDESAFAVVEIWQVIIREKDN